MNPVLIEPNRFLNLNVNVTGCNLCARVNVKGHRELNKKSNRPLPWSNWSRDFKFGSSSFKGDRVIQQSV